MRASRDAWLAASDRHLDNDLNLRCARLNAGLVAECLITISMEIPLRDRGRRVADSRTPLRQPGRSERTERGRERGRGGGRRRNDEKVAGQEKAT